MQYHAQSVVDFLRPTFYERIGGEPVPPEGKLIWKTSSATGTVISKIPRSQELDIPRAFVVHNRSKEWGVVLRRTC